jgi:predicted dienelactone hydrolase
VCSSHGVRSTGIEPATAFVAGSIRRRRAAAASETQTEPAAPTTPHGSPPRSSFATTSVPGVATMAATAARTAGIRPAIMSSETAANAHGWRYLGALTRTVRTFVDDSRPTAAEAGLPGAPSRTLVTHLYFPDSAEPAPLVVFAHGFTGHPRKFTRLLSAWAGAGYVVAAPTFPLTSDEVPGKSFFDDVAEQPADVRFVLDEVLDAYPDRVDPGRIAAAGFSLGGMTTFGVAFDSSLRDERLRAAIAISGRLYPFGGEYDVGGMPLLVVHGERDEIVPYREGLAAYRRARPPQALLTLHVPGHHEPIEDTPATAADGIVPEATTAFLDLTLEDDAEAAGRLAAAARQPFATLETEGL